MSFKEKSYNIVAERENCNSNSARSSSAWRSNDTLRPCVGETQRWRTGMLTGRLAGTQ